MKLYKFMNIRVFIFLCFCFVSNLSFAQFNELSGKISLGPIKIVVLPTSHTLIGETNIVVPNNRIQTYKMISDDKFSLIDINNDSWEVIKGEIISYGFAEVTVKWNTAGIGSVKCTPTLSLSSYSLQVNITSNLTGNKTMFIYDTSGNQISAKLD